MAVEGNLVALSLVAWNLGNYAFFLIAGRALGPSDYGLTASLLAVVVIGSVPCGALQAAVGQAVAASPSVGMQVYRRVLRKTLYGATVGLVVGGIALVIIDQTHPGLPLTSLLLTLGSVVLLPGLLTALGALQGSGRFVAFATGFALWGLPRPILLVPFVIFGVGIVGPLIATLAAIAIATVFAIGAANRVVPPVDAEQETPDWLAVSASVRSLAAALTGVAILTNVDVIVAKGGLPDREAGHFAAVAVLAKAILIVPQSLAFVLLPRIARRHARGESTANLLLLAVSGTMCAAGVAALLSIPFGEPIVRITFGAEYVPAADLLPAFFLASGLLGTVLVLVNQQAATATTGYGRTLVPIGLFQLVLFALFHGSAGALITVDAIAGALGVLAYELVVRRGGNSLFSMAGTWRRRSG